MFARVAKSFTRKSSEAYSSRSARGWFEELMKLVSANISAKLPRVVAGCVGDVVLQLEGVSHLALRQIHAEADRRARWTSVEAARPSSTISIDGINSERGSRASVAEALRRKAPRISLIHFGDSTLVNWRFTPCVREGTIDEKPGGVICEAATPGILPRAPESW